MGNFRRPLLNKLKKSQTDGFVAWFFIIVILLTFSIVFLVLNKAWSDIKNPLGEGLNQSVPTGDRETVSGVLDKTGSSTQSFDKLLPFLIIGLFGFIMILAGSIMKHPIMIFVGVILLGVIVLLAVIYSNLYQDIAESESFSDTNDTLPIQNKFMQFLPFIVIIGAVAIISALLWRDKGMGGQL